MKPVRKAKEMAIIAIKQSAKPAKKRKIESKSTQTTAKTDDFRLKDCSVSVERLPAELQQGSVRIAINDKNDDSAKSTENAVGIVYIEKNVNAVTEDTERLPMRIESNSVVRDVSKKIAKTSNRQKANSRAAPIAAKKGVRRILSQGDIERNESSGPGHSNMTHPTKRVRAPSVHVVESNKNDDDAAVSSVHDNLVRVKGGGNYADVVKIIKEKSLHPNADHVCNTLTDSIGAQRPNHIQMKDVANPVREVLPIPDVVPVAIKVEKDAENAVQTAGNDGNDGHNNSYPPSAMTSSTTDPNAIPKRILIREITNSVRYGLTDSGSENEMVAIKREFLNEENGENDGNDENNNLHSTGGKPTMGMSCMTVIPKHILIREITNPVRYRLADSESGSELATIKQEIMENSTENTE